MRKFCALAVLASVLGCAGVRPVPNPDASRGPASSHALLDCDQYETLEEKKLCTLGARQILEAMGYFLESGILQARREYVFRAKIPVPRTRYAAGPIAVMATLFTASGASAMASATSSASRPGALANRLLESVAVTPIGVRGASLTISSLGGGSAVASSTFAKKPDVRADEGSVAQGSMNFQLLFRKKRVGETWVGETEKDRAAAETAFRAEIGKISQELVDKLALLYLDEDQAESVKTATFNQIVDGFEGKDGKFDDKRQVKIDLVGILRSLGGDMEKKMKLLDALIGKSPESIPDLKGGSDLKYAIATTYSMLDSDLTDLLDSYEDRSVDAKRGFDRQTAEGFLADESEYVINLKSFIGRLKTTRKLLVD